MPKRTGILLPIPSLPGPYGIGDFGDEARHWIDQLALHHIYIWQILPINPLGYGHSPYQPFSSKAGEPLLISLDRLYQEGYIQKPEKPQPSSSVDYEAVSRYKAPYFHEAFMTMKKDEEKQKAFAAYVKRQPWVKDYGIFAAFKAIHQQRAWSEWEAPYQNYPQTRDPELIAQHDEEITYHMFLQFLFASQWQSLKDYAHAKKISILGDIPFYVGIDSLDVWMNQDEFLLDEQGRPTFIAGVPPDYFSPTGQRWGNPIYNWEHMQKNGYQFWIDRLAYVSTLFDIVRIDHFRAFDTYWKIPASCPTAIEGEWIEGPAYDFFDTVLKALPDLQIIAEDLGDLRDEVLELRDHYDFPGMQVIQFHLDPATDNAAVEKKENLVLYTGTHDNETLFGWYLELPFQKRRDIWNYLSEHGFTQSTIDWRLIAYCLATQANTVIFPVQDLLCLKNEARINTPGTLNNINWCWRLSDMTALEKQLAELETYIKQYERI